MTAARMPKMHSRAASNNLLYEFGSNYCVLCCVCSSRATCVRGTQKNAFVHAMHVVVVVYAMAGHIAASRTPIASQPECINYASGGREHAEDTRVRMGSGDWFRDAARA